MRRVDKRDAPSPTQDVVMQRFGVPLLSLDAWRWLHDVCAPELIDLVNAGSLNTMYVVELARLPAEAQREVAGLGPAACRTVARELRNLRAGPVGPTCPYCRRPKRGARDQLTARVTHIAEVAASDINAAARKFNEFRGSKEACQ